MYKFQINDDQFLPQFGCQVDLSVGPGLAIGLVGKNGVGKTSLAKKIYFHSVPTISLIEQGPLNLFYNRPLKKLKELFLFSRNSHVDENALNRYWDQFHLKNKEDLFSSSLSGGEGQALKLCLGLSIKKPIYILDEPSQYLDNKSRILLSDILKELLAQKKALIIIEHDLSWINFPMQITELELSNNKLQKGRSWTT